MSSRFAGFCLFEWYIYVPKKAGIRTYCMCASAFLGKTREEEKESEREREVDGKCTKQKAQK